MMDIVKETQQILGSGEGELYKVLPAYIQKLIEEEAWQGRKNKDGREFTSFEDFVTTDLWHGLGSTIGDLKLYCKKEPDVVRMIDAAVGAMLTRSDAGKKGGRGNKADSNATSFNDRGATYVLKRLKRDYPELAERVVSGQLSAHAAAVEAGFRARSISFPQNITPDSMASKIREKFGDDFADELARRLM